ncbi:MAG: ABC transporter ATP-binding protein, partial [Armatimonadetes bacterium]|nr:ABC transporter ATP-binding protein [Armatimonadota bacterium]
MRLERVTKRFGGVLAVDEVSLGIPAGQLVTFLGPSGCGKTTTLRMVAGLEVPTSGRVFIGDEDVTPLPASNRSVTMVFQSYALFPHLTVYENVAYGLRIAKLPEAAIARQVADVLELVGLPQVGRRYPALLSGGQQQRVALARALVMKPKVLLFDEPLSNLDAKLRKRVRAEIRELQQRLGITSIYVTHDQAEAMALSDVIVVMNQGKVEQIGTPSDLYRRPASRFVADFVGEANLLPGQYADGQVTLGPVTFSFRQDDIPSGPVTVMARPETIRVRTDGSGLPGNVRTAFFMGTTIEYLINTPVGEVNVAEPPTARMLPLGAEVRLSFEEASLYLLPDSPYKANTSGEAPSTSTSPKIP